MPSRPSSAMSGMTSDGKRSCASQSAACGTTCLLQKSRTVFCRTCWSSDRSKFMGSLARWLGAFGAEALFGTGGRVDLHHDRRRGAGDVGELSGVGLIGRDVEG